MPRAFSSGALSIWSYAVNVAPPVSARTFVIAAVSDVLPWSTWPIVPMLQCGLFRSNLAFAIVAYPSFFMSGVSRDKTRLRRSALRRFGFGGQLRGTAGKLERVEGIEPSSSAWKAVALPLSYTRLIRIPSFVRPAIRSCAAAKDGGGGWIRTNVGVA